MARTLTTNLQLPHGVSHLRLREFSRVRKSARSMYRLVGRPGLRPNDQEGMHDQENPPTPFLLPVRCQMSLASCDHKTKSPCFLEFAEVQRLFFSSPLPRTKLGRGQACGRLLSKIISRRDSGCMHYSRQYDVLDFRKSLGRSGHSCTSTLHAESIMADHNTVLERNKLSRRPPQRVKRPTLNCETYCCLCVFLVGSIVGFTTATVKANTRRKETKLLYFKGGYSCTASRANSVFCSL